MSSSTHLRTVRPFLLRHLQLQTAKKWTETEIYQCQRRVSTVNTNTWFQTCQGSRIRVADWSPCRRSSQPRSPTRWRARAGPWQEPLHDRRQKSSADSTGKHCPRDTRSLPDSSLQAWTSYLQAAAGIGSEAAASPACLWRSEAASFVHSRRSAELFLACFRRRSPCIVLEWCVLILCSTPPIIRLLLANVAYKLF